MADLAGIPGRAGHDLPAQDDAAADPGPDEGGDDVAVASPGTQPELGVSGDADVVLDEHGPVEEGRQLGADRVVLHVQVRAEEDHARLDVERPGRADSAGHHVVARDAGGEDRLVHALDHRLEDRRPSFLGGRVALAAAQDPMIGADHAGQYLRSAEVDADHGRSTPLPCHDERSEPLTHVRRNSEPSFGPL